MSADAGKKIFTKACAQCHTVEQGGKHKQGGFLIPFSIFFRMNLTSYALAKQVPTSTDCSEGRQDRRPTSPTLKPTRTR